MTHRFTADTITDDALDQLYDDLARNRAALSDMTRDRDRWQWYRNDALRKMRIHGQRADTAEVALARVRALRDTWLLMTLEPGQVRRLLDQLTHALDGEQPHA